jgi:hypothetical protein
MWIGYFDDSGTHAGSRFAVWGGLVGPAIEYERLDVAWRELLATPMEGKPPLSKFSLAQCIARDGEFESYNAAERDLIRHRFRHLLDRTDLAPIACIVDANAWNERLSPLAKRFLGEAQNKAFLGCLEIVQKIIAGSKEAITIHFDIGQAGIVKNSLLAAFEAINPNVHENIVVNFSSVASLSGLQAADMVAGEAYRYFMRGHTDGASNLDAHFRDFVKENGALFHYFGEEEIVGFSAKWEQTVAPVLALMEPVIDRLNKRGKSR